MASEITWVLVSKDGERRNLSPQMLFIGTHECEVTLKCKSVDKQHSVINYDSIQKAYRIKDLGSSNGTFVNETRLPEKIYITLKHGDQVRFGYGSEEFSISRIVRVRNLSQKDRLSSSASSKSSATKPSTLSSNSSSVRSSVSFTVKSKSTAESQPKQQQQQKDASSPHTPIKTFCSVPTMSSKEPKLSSSTSESVQGRISKNSESNSQEKQKNRKSKGWSFLFDKPRFFSKKKRKNSAAATSESVDNWFNVNRPSRTAAAAANSSALQLETTHEAAEEVTRSTKAAGKVSSKADESNGKQRPTSWADKTQKGRQRSGSNGEEVLAAEKKTNARNSLRRKNKMKKSSRGSCSSGSSSSSDPSKASECGTYTVEGDEPQLKVSELCFTFLRQSFKTFSC